MAEVVGVVAAGVAFVEVIPKIISGTMKLRNMWEDFKEVPDSIKSLSVRIEFYAMALKPMDLGVSSPTLDEGLWASSVGPRIVAQCREAVEVLSKSVDDVSQELMSAKRMRRAVLKGKLVLKKDFWAKTEQSLHEVASMLSVAMDLRIISSTDRVLDMVICLSQKNDQRGQVQDPDKPQEETHEMPNHPLLVRKSDAPVDQKQFALMSSHRGESMIGSIGFDWTRSSDGSRWRASPRSEGSLGCDKYYFQFKPPNWLTRKAWSIASAISTGGFDVKLRAYSVVPEDSPVFQLARRGDIEGLLGLFDRRLASPFDIDENGRSLLNPALLASQTHAVAAMVGWGLNLSELLDPERSTSPWPRVFGVTGHDRGDSFKDVVHELALANNFYDEYADFWLHPTIGLNNGWATLTRMSLVMNPGALKFFLPYVRPGHYRLPAHDRLSYLTVHGLIVSDWLRVESVRYVLWSDGKVQKEDIRALDAINFSLVNLILGRHIWRHNNPADESNECEGWRQLLRDIIPWTSLLHSYGEPCDIRSLDHFERQVTALHTLIRPILCTCTDTDCEESRTFSQWRRGTERRLQHWLEDLQEGGIDLNGYGKMESKIFREIYEIKEIVHQVSIYCGSWCSLAAFSYGPEPKDWKFTWDLRCEDMVGQFWELIDNPPLKLPGAWYD